MMWLHLMPVLRAVVGPHETISKCSNCITTPFLLPPSGYVPDDTVMHEIGADNNIVVGWPAVTPEDGREFLQRYRIDFTSVPRSTSVRRRKRQSASPLFAGPDATSVTLDPVPYSEYTVMVTAEFEADGTPFTALITAPTIIQSNEEGQSGNTFLSFSLLNLMPSLPPSLPSTH